MDTQVIKQNFDGRADFREALADAREQYRQERNFAMSIRIGRALRRRSVFEDLYEAVVKQASVDLMSSPRRAEFGDGEFAKWFLEWFAENWETIVEFIKAIIPIFAGLI